MIKALLLLAFSYEYVWTMESGEEMTQPAQVSNMTAIIHRGEALNGREGGSFSAPPLYENLMYITGGKC